MTALNPTRSYPDPEFPMPALSPWNLDPTRLLTRRELATVLADLAARAPGSANVQRNLVVVRLACCCGLRVSEIAALQLDDVIVALLGLTSGCGVGPLRAGARGACLCGGMPARLLIWKSGRLSVRPRGLAAPPRSFARCRHTGVGCLCDELRSGVAFCQPVRSWEWPVCGR
jgi:hypothetical protein